MITFNRSALLILIALPVFLALASLLTISIIISSSRPHIYTSIVEIPHAEAALILGAGVLRSGDLSSVLQDRVDEAIDLYTAKKVEKIIASGNRSSSYNEVDPVVEYLTKHGVPRSDILTDYAGYDTYSSIFRARSLFNVVSVTIVTQSFHLPRAIYIARKLDLEANGISADRGHYKLGNYFREMLADVKAMINIITHRQPHRVDAASVPNEQGESDYLFPVW
jgi:SanA protein